MSSAGRAASSSGCVGKPREQETGLTGYAAAIQHSSLTGSSVMEPAEHREPYESRGSRTDLGAPRGESPLGDSTSSPIRRLVSHRLQSAESGLAAIAIELAGPTQSCPSPRARYRGDPKLPAAAVLDFRPQEDDLVASANTGGHTTNRNIRQRFL